MVRRQSPGQRDVVYGRLGREHKNWVWKAERDDKTFDILESRSRLDVPSGRDFPKILESKSLVQKSSAGSWPAILPPSREEVELATQLDLVRESYIKLHGLPSNIENDLSQQPSSSQPTNSLLEETAPASGSSLPASAESLENSFEDTNSKIDGSNTNPSSPNEYSSNMNTSNMDSNADSSQTQYTQSYMNDNSVHSNPYRDDNFLDETFETKYSKQFMGESFQVSDDSGGGSGNGVSEETTSNQKKEMTEEEKREQFQRLLASISQPKKLTFSMSPAVRKTFNPKDVRWDNRHHVSVSSKNKVLHNIHREFFDNPKGFDMCTKPLKILPREPITEKLMQVVDRDEVRIYPRTTSLSSSSSLPRPSASRGVSRSRQLPDTRPASRQISTPISQNTQLQGVSSRGSSRGDGVNKKHSESYLQPYALSRKTSGNELYVPGSFKL